MKMSFLNALIGMMMASVSPLALACSYYINETAVKNDLGAKLLTELKISIDDVTSVEVSDFSFFESKSTPMCPDEMTYLSTFQISFNNASDPLAKGCVAIAKVTKVEPWVEGLETTYSYEIIQSPTCLQ
jgi:hypothetical protein